MIFDPEIYCTAAETAELDGTAPLALAGDGLTAGTLSAGELEHVSDLKRSKYDTWAWNFGRSPKYDMVNKRYWDGGCLEVHAAVEKGLLTDIAFYGDFLSRCPLDGLTAALRGCAFRREDVAAVLERYPLQDYFGGITENEVLETMFHVHE